MNKTELGRILTKHHNWLNSISNGEQAYLREADLRWANLQSPTMLLLCNWKTVSDKLTQLLMRYDAVNHPQPKEFDTWATGGACPYQKGFARCANFTEKRELWKPGRTKSARELVLMLFKEKGIKFSEGT